MSDHEHLSIAMWALLFTLADQRLIARGVRIPKSTLDALERRGLIQVAPGGGWALSEYGRALVDRVQQDVRL